MTTLFDMFETNTTKEEDGVWVEFTPTCRLLLARAGGANKRFAKALEKRSKPHRRAIQTETLNNEIAHRMMLEVYAEAVVLNWEGVTERDGTPIEFSYQNAISLLERLPGLFKFIREEAARDSLFRDAVQEADAKN